MKLLLLAIGPPNKVLILGDLMVWLAFNMDTLGVASLILVRVKTVPRGSSTWLGWILYGNICSPLRSSCSPYKLGGLHQKFL